MSKFLALLLSAALLFSANPAVCQSKVSGSSRFFREIYEQPKTTRADAVRAACFMVSKGGPAWTFEEAMAILKEKKILPSNWKVEGNTPLNKGFLSNILLRIIRHESNQSGGIFVRMWGINDRTAYRECLHHQILSPGGENKFVAGCELVGAINQASRFIRERRNYK
ncbi:MAG: hypothetical protein CVV64_07960 [Candidatus Wallbacteria bacterium HGW-Wallbacteria-1]|jgi:hypothetical protein|uniref:Mannosyl-glycoprotein endo-beta-N-acetylglucosamidase-like domain-containing protein n=1 Tax=Candidatus Wallbacteria bacterium HGW-Wallbacteria-1 TaxID=2013854 RepID=A0A2N1PR48_9BACT|nr:MAG: hypothetical protein CVV64_07960 [Candidatus Wallbacteria bacterium HGW-Wallbacteria-1]